ncbi:MAG TPA: EF-hand domain-containing protein, partial [Blastocatellia bacterium]
FQSTFALLVFALGATIAAAQDFPPPQGPPQEGMRRQMQMPSFADLDKNKDKKISRDEFQGPPQFFDRLDENKDGFIDEEEFNRIRRNMGGGNPSERFVRLMDANKDGKITREEFARILQVFDALDKDHSGDLSQEEMGRFYQAMNEVENQATGGVEVNALFEKYDKDKDGKITPEEWGNEKTFKAMDLNKDNLIMKEELGQALRQLQQRAGQKSSNPPK